jgi:hypothetical protein
MTNEKRKGLGDEGMETLSLITPLLHIAEDLEIGIFTGYN